MGMTRTTRVLASLAGVLLLPGVSLPSLPSTATPASGALAHDASTTTFRDLSCPTARVCTAVGGSSTSVPSVYRTVDGGATWTQQAVSLDAPKLTNVSCPTATYCIAEGDVGIVQSYDELHFAVTRDAGASWSAPPIVDVIGNAGALACAGERRCYELGGYGYLERSTDGGANWKRLIAQGWPSVDDVACRYRSTCFVVGQTRTSALQLGRLVGYGARIASVVRIPDTQGRNHLRISCPTGVSCSIIDYHFGGGAFLATSDAGSTWMSWPLPFATHDVTGFSCLSPHVCIALVAAHGASHILRTTDGGASWKTSASTEPLLASLSCGSSTDCVAVGADGSVLDTVDAGSSWTEESTITP
jgi:photosystem II stability/assembly factor-like uncharacterized protein